MANEVPNAVLLRKDPEWREWLIVGAAYQARVVLLESPDIPDHAIREAMAKIVAVRPEEIIDTLVTVITCDPTVCSRGSTPAAVTQTVMLTKIEEAWTKLAQLLYTV